MFGWNYWNGDYDAYRILYDSRWELFLLTEYETGYQILMFLGNLFDLSFQQFFIILSGVILLLWIRIVFKLSLHPAYFTFCFFIVFIPLDYVLVRNFLAFSIVMQGVVSVFNDSSFKYPKFIFAVLLAATIHITSIFYILLLFAFRPKVLSIKKIVLVICVGLCVLFLFREHLMQIVSSYTLERDEIYKSSLRSFVSYSTIQVLSYLVILHFYNKAKKKMVNQDMLITKYQKQTLINTMILNSNIILFILIILYTTVAITIRIFRLWGIVNVLYITNIIFDKNNKDAIKPLDVIIFILYLFYFFIEFIYTVLDDTLFSLYKYNLIFH